MKIKRVGVVGAGIMGAGIVQVCAQSGYEVVVSEVNDELLQKGMGTVDHFLGRAVQKEKITAAQKDEVMGRIQGTTDIKDFKDCDLIVEAIIENLDLKKELFKQLGDSCPPHALLTSNTSSMTITEMAAASGRMDKVAGLHFFNPVPVMRLVEIVTTIVTADETVKALKEFSESLGKTVVIAKDTPGFIVNRLLIPYLLHAIRLYESGLASIEDIDTAIELGLNHPMGPFRLLDILGNDTTLFIADNMFNEFKDDTYAAPVLLKRMVTAGILGRKSGKGFYGEYK
ncbi:MAG TPA: 3-hydroxybutyryl-CoA dehydrogenase [Anaerolineae bacterium]|nr:3-hydroxybutyryl-CoA dehydrogenase [Anaerolineae bacterium]